MIKVNDNNIWALYRKVDIIVDKFTAIVIFCSSLLVLGIGTKRKCIKYGSVEKEIESSGNDVNSNTINSRPSVCYFGFCQCRKVSIKIIFAVH